MPVRLKRNITTNIRGTAGAMEANIEEEISRDRNMNIAWIGGTLSIGIAAFIFFML